MKTETINAGWTLSGKIMGAGQVIVKESLALPFSLSNFAHLCGKEGLFLRQWRMSACIEKPLERKTSLSERWFLTLDGIEGEGEARIGEEAICALRPQLEVDVTRWMQGGACALSLVFPPHLPCLFPGETGEDLPIEIGLFSAKVRAVYFARLLFFDIQNGAVTVKLEAFGAGRVLVKLRLLFGDALIWYENIETQVHVGENEISCPVSVPVPNGAVLRVLAERGGEGCDEGERVVCGNLPKPVHFAHFRKIPSDSVLQSLVESGFHAVVLHASFNETLEANCRRLGLCLILAQREIPLHPMLQYEDTEEGACPLPLCGEENKAAVLTRHILHQRETRSPIHLYACGRQRDDDTGLFTADGTPLPALSIVRRALSPVFVTAAPDKPRCIPGAHFNIEILLYQRAHEGEILRIEAHLREESGKTLKSGFFTVCAKGEKQSVGTLETAVPWSLTGELTLYLSVLHKDEPLAENLLKIPRLSLA